jgi:hypothetical protein
LQRCRPPVFKIANEPAGTSSDHWYARALHPWHPLELVAVPMRARPVELEPLQVHQLGHWLGADRRVEAVIVHDEHALVHADLVQHQAPENSCAVRRWSPAAGVQHRTALTCRPASTAPAPAARSRPTHPAGPQALLRPILNTRSHASFSLCALQRPVSTISPD